MHRKFVCLQIIFLLCLLGWSLHPMAATVSALPSVYTVNSTGDAHAAPPLNDGMCRTATNNTTCTLRAAIEKANYSASGAVINFGGVTPPATYTLPLGQLVISNTMTIAGDGSDKTIIDGDGFVTNQRVLYIITHTVNISGVTIAKGKQTYTGTDPNAFAGGILHNDALTITNSVVSNNTALASSGAAYGGGIYSSGKLVLIHSIVAGNLVTTTNGGIASGGGIVGNATLINSTVSNNIARDNGGGIYGGATLMASTVNGNVAFDGAGIDGGSMTLINSTISGNSARNSGGGIYHSGGTGSLYNVTIASNIANSRIIGAGLGGGIYNASGNVDFRNTILANNIVVSSFNGHPLANPEDCAGTLSSQGYNLVSETTDCTINGPFIPAGPSLGPLQDNGGPTLTHALLTGSRGIDEGQPGNCTDNLATPILTDQRGFPRPVNDGRALRCDIGAYEVQQWIFLPLIRR